MDEVYVYHAVTEWPMAEGQVILFDENHHNGVYHRITTCKQIMDGANPSGEIAEMIRANPEDWIPCTYQELALEKVRREEFPSCPSRLSCLYTARTFEEARDWAIYFREIGRTVFGLAKIHVKGRVFAGDACNCFDGTPDEQYNIEMARHYWNRDVVNERPCIELLADGILTVVELTDI